VLDPNTKKAKRTKKKRLGKIVRVGPTEKPELSKMVLQWVPVKFNKETKKYDVTNKTPRPAEIAQVQKEGVRKEEADPKDIFDAEKYEVGSFWVYKKGKGTTKDPYTEIKVKVLSHQKDGSIQVKGKGQFQVFDDRRMIKKVN